MREGAAGKAAIQLVKVQPCQLPRTDTKRCHSPQWVTTAGDAWCKRPGRPTAGLSRWVQPGGLASVGA